MRSEDIKQFTRCSGYCTDVDWKYLLQHVQSAQTERLAKLDLDPDFQRPHVWTRDQQISYVEYALRGGTSGRDLYFNCVGWGGSYQGPYVIVDGKQRLHAAMEFLSNRLPVFGGHLLSDFEDGLRPLLGHTCFRWHVNSLSTRAAVLTWYLEMNTGGTVHTQDELDRVRALLAAEK